MVIVRASRSKATRKLQSIDDFIEAEWNKVLEVIASEGAIEYEVRIELQAESLKGKGSLKRPLDVLSSDPLEPSSLKARNTRTDKLLDRARIRADHLTAAGNFDRELLHRWQCIDRACRNFNGWCFVDFAGKHFNMDHTQQSLWGKAIATGDDGVTIERPPISLYRFWTGSQGGVTQDSRRSLAYQEKLKTRTDREETKDFMGKFMRFNEQQMEMRLAETMTDQMERMTSRQRPSLPPPPPQQPPQQWQPSLVNSSYPAYQPASYSQWQQPVSWQEASPPPSSLIPSLFFASSSRPSRSSLIGSSEEEKAVIEQFFL